MDGNNVFRAMDLAAQKPQYQLDTQFYDAIRAVKPDFPLLTAIDIPPLGGRAIAVQGGQSFRVIQMGGPQIAVVAFWGLHNPKELYGAIRSRLWEGLFVGVYTRLWSEVPWLRPMMTCIDDTVDHQSADSSFHHHRFGTHCSSETLERRFGRKRLISCRTNLLEAIKPFGLNAKNLADDIVLFHKVQLNQQDGKLYGAKSDAKAGDYVEFYAEIDLLVAVSSCPLGDGTNDLSQPGEAPARPLRIEVYDTGIRPKEFPKWTDWRRHWTGRWAPPKWWLDVVHDAGGS